MENNLSYLDEKINLEVLVNFYLRNKSLMIIFTVFFFLLFSVYAVLKKPRWEGKFEIVLNKNKENSLIGSLPSQLKDRIPLKNSSNSLATEVGILKSPYILKPVLDYVNSQNKEGKNLKFTPWRDNNLNIKLIKPTSILQISYQDKNKELIIPVLNKIKDAYQIYSGENKKKIIRNLKDYLKKQIEIYSKQSTESINKAQEFGTKEDLIENTPIVKDSMRDFFTSNISIEKMRVNASNEIRAIDIQIKKLEKIKDESDEIQYFGNLIIGKESEAVKKLAEMDFKLSEMLSKYTPKDIEIRRLKEERKIYIEKLKKRYISILNVRKISFEALKESLTRPREVLIKYKELLREAARDESTLIKLENQLRETELEEAKLQDPWKLITAPFLMDSPVNLPKEYILILGIFNGFILGTIFVFFKEKKSNLIFEKSTFERKLNTKILEEINFKKDEFNINSKEIFLNEILLNKKYSSIKLVNLSNIKNAEVIKFTNLLKAQEINAEFENDFKNINDNDSLILLASLGNENFKDLQILQNRLSNINKSINGIIIFEV